MLSWNSLEIVHQLSQIGTMRPEKWLHTNIQLMFWKREI